ncbi:hypothetical protein MMC25_006081 [Agyrium rufum]|nr:hypothetical protein [Agyrium rufum]
MTAGECARACRIETYELYKVLQVTGAPVNRLLGPDGVPWGPSLLRDEDSQLSDYWREQWKSYKRQVVRWDSFLSHQARIRRDTVKFNEATEKTRELQQKRKLNVHVEWKFRFEDQSRLDLWRQYYLHEHRELRLLEGRIERAQRCMQSAQEEPAAAESDGMVLAPTWNPWEPEWQERHGCQDLCKSIKSTQDRMESLGSEESPSATVIGQALEELRSLQKRLEKTRKELEIENGYCQAKGGLSVVERELKEHTAWLQSIEAHISIVTEQAGSTQESEGPLDSHHRPHRTK